MPKRIYVGNLPFTADAADLRRRAERHGAIDGITIKPDDASGTASAVIVFEGEGPNTLVDELDGLTVGGNKIVASTDPNVVGPRHC